MKTRELLLLVVTALASSWICVARPEGGTDSSYSTRAPRTLAPREIITEDDILDAYDYVICGGGLAGLVIASRLSANNTVLVLEAGKSGDDIADRINTPDGAFYSSIVGTEYDWGRTTVPQPNLNNRTISWPHGKILGGSSAMNAMYLIRPASQELDAWQRIITPDDSTAATKWGWNEMYSAMKRSENFTAPQDDVAGVGKIQWDASAYGSGGSMSVSYPGVMMQIIGNWTSSLSSIGVPALPNPNSGTTLGGFVTPSSINPTNWTRSYSRSAYIATLPPSQNKIHILPQETVIRIHFRTDASLSGWIAERVEFSQNREARRKFVKVKREVILCAGVIGSPKILMLSGFGPQDVLESAGVGMVEELPGVGQRLQDHLTAGVVWQSNQETAGNIHDSNSDFANSPEFKSFINDAVAYVNFTSLFDGPAGSLAFQQQILSSLQSSSSTIPQTRSPDVMEGYKAIYQTLANDLVNASTAQVELLMNVMGSGTVSIQAALQHPFSVGKLWVKNADPFEDVLIDPGYFSHFADIITLRQAIKLVRAVGTILSSNTTGTTPLLGQELKPGPGVVADADIEAWLRGDGGVSSQFHPSSSCGMFPRAQGGVVDSKLRVYGAANVRIADTSVFPFVFAAHLASVTYGLAEQAAVIIQEEPYTVPSTGTRTIRSCCSFVVMLVSILVSLWMFV